MPEPDTDSLLTIAHDVAARRRSAVDVVTEHLVHAEMSQGTLNAFTLIDGDRALDRARLIDHRIAQGEQVGPLAGVPIGVKDLIDHAGRPTTNGGRFRAEVAARSAPSVARLENAGAVVIGRTGLHEHAFGFSSENHWFGPVRNPWDPSLSPGGSSGGSGAAVAAGIVHGALGTDTGGSVRVPAALCGIVGLKVTHGRVPLTGVSPLSETVDTVGPLARSVADTAALYTVIAGDDPSDPWSQPQIVEEPQFPADLTRLRVGLPRPWIDQPTTPEVRLAFRDAMNALADAGAEIVDLDLPDLEPPGLIEEAMYPEVADVHRRRLEREPDKYGPDVAVRLQRALEFGLDDYIAGRRWQGKLRAVAMRALLRVDVLATPTVAAMRKPIGQDRIDVDGELASYRPALSRFTSLVNQLRLPALALPLPAGEAPPPSLQLIGPAWSEHRLLEIGQALEAAGITATQRPPVWRP